MNVRTSSVRPLDMPVADRRGLSFALFLCDDTAFSDSLGDPNAARKPPPTAARADTGKLNNVALATNTRKEMATTDPIWRLRTLPDAGDRESDTVRRKTGAVSVWRMTLATEFDLDREVAYFTGLPARA